MKKNVLQMGSVLVAVVLVFAGSFSVSAARYKSKLVSDDFADASASKFICPGDIVKNGVVDESDTGKMRKILLEIDDEVDYSDVDFDGHVDLIDLVKCEQSIGNGFQNGQLSFNGKCVYAPKLSTNTGAGYQVTYRYKTAGGFKVQFNLAGELKTYTETSTGEWKTATYDITSFPKRGSAQPDFDLLIDGDGTLDDFSIKRVNMDNDAP